MNSKCISSDVGLFVSQLEEGASSDILNDKLGICKGALCEELVTDAFSKNGRKTGLEIDFVTRCRRQATLIEGKAHNEKRKRPTKFRRIQSDA